MAAADTFKVIYLGQLAQTDTTEGNGSVENANAILGTYEDFTPASVQTFSPISYSSDDGSRSATRFQTYNQNNTLGTDTFRITQSDGTQTSHGFDSIWLYNANITYADGTTAPAQLLIMQDTAGNTWVAPPSSFSPGAALLGAEPIQGIQLTSVVPGQLPVAGMFFNRENITTLETVVCFANGTRIRCARGDIPVEELVEGDLVETRDNGLQPIRWIGSRHLTADDLGASAHLRPIRIARGALGGEAPYQDLIVSPQHRMLVRSRIAQRMFSTDEVLVAAKNLVALDGIDMDATADEVEYFHLMFDRHEIVLANGAETESFYAGPEALKSIGEAAQQELFTLFPELRDGATPDPARPLLPGRIGRKLGMRHALNGKPLQLN